MSFNSIPLKDLLGRKGYIRGPFGSALKRAELKGEGIPVYEQQHAIRGDRVFRYFIDEDKYKTLQRFTVQANDLIISCSGTVGKISVIREEDPQGIISQALLILRPDAIKVLPEYLYYFFTSKQGFNELINASQGAVQLNIAPRDIVEKIPIPLPEISQQEEIVSVLKTIDDKINLNIQTNQTLEQIAQAIFKSWFVDFDPVRAKMAVLEEDGTHEAAERAAMCAISAKNDDALTRMQREAPEAYAQLAQTAALFPSAMVESELGEIPEGWSVVRTAELAEKITKGSTPRKIDLQNARDSLNIPFIKVKDISDDNTILRAGLEKIPTSIHETFLKRSILKTNDLLFSIAGTIGRVTIVPEDLDGSNANQAVALVRIKDVSNHLWLIYQTLKSKRIQDEIRSKVVQGVQANASLTNIRDIQVLLPDNDFLGFWSKTINPMYLQQLQLFKQNGQLMEARDALLPKLLSGEIDLVQTQTEANKATT